MRIVVCLCAISVWALAGMWLTTPLAQAGRRRSGISPTLVVPVPAPPPAAPPTAAAPVRSTQRRTASDEELAAERESAAGCGATIVSEEELIEMRRRGAAIYRRAELTEPATITSKPEPGYTRLARSEGTEGRVRLVLLLAGDGKVSHIAIVDSLPSGLTNESIRAACGIRFRPAVKDGRAVGQLITVTYNFVLTNDSILMPRGKIPLP